MTASGTTPGTASGTSSRIAETTFGRVEGRERAGALLFAGIPYAAPPTGEHRFGPPRPPEPWTDVRPAQRFGAAAPQPSGEPGSLTGIAPKSMDEDCLSLNVCTPGCDEAGRPVFVWVHGGAFRSGTGAVPWYDGASFANEHDVVTVTINYRLGALGFLNLDGTNGGVNGLLDQLAALRWVQANIAAFGGDPARVTVAGESAGAMSVTTLLAMPESAGLFRSAVAQSGAAKHVLDADTSAYVAAAFVDELGADPRTASVDELLAAQVRTEARMLADDRLGGSGMAFQPTIDGQALPGHPLELIKGGAASDVALMIGTNLDESSLWGGGPKDEERLLAKLAGMGPDPAEAVGVYRQRLGPDASPGSVFIAANTDRTFRQPAIDVAEAHQGDTWSYLFTWASRVPGLGSTHALEIPFMFNTIDRPGTEFFLGDGPAPTELASTMHAAWAGFIADGDPGWSSYDTSDRTTMRFDDRSGVESDPLGAERELWAGLAG